MIYFRIITIAKLLFENVSMKQKGGDKLKMIEMDWDAKIGMVLYCGAYLMSHSALSDMVEQELLKAIGLTILMGFMALTYAVMGFATDLFDDDLMQVLIGMLALVSFAGIYLISFVPALVAHNTVSIFHSMALWLAIALGLTLMKLRVMQLNGKLPS
jgi:NAD/NADP transhydrogenase beta subunit